MLNLRLSLPAMAASASCLLLMPAPAAGLRAAAVHPTSVTDPVPVSAGLRAAAVHPTSVTEPIPVYYPRSLYPHGYDAKNYFQEFRSSAEGNEFNLRHVKSLLKNCADFVHDIRTTDWKTPGPRISGGRRRKTRESSLRETARSQSSDSTSREDDLLNFNRFRNLFVFYVFTIHEMEKLDLLKIEETENSGFSVNFKEELPQELVPLLGKRDPQRALGSMAYLLDMEAAWFNPYETHVVLPNLDAAVKTVSPLYRLYLAEIATQQASFLYPNLPHKAPTVQEVVAMEPSERDAIIAWFVPSECMKLAELPGHQLLAPETRYGMRYLLGSLRNSTSKIQP